MKKVLLTGFGPFGKESINPALLVIQELDNQKLVLNKGKNNPEAKIVSKELSVVFRKTINEFITIVETINPDLILSIGQAGGRMGISLERIGINVADADIADNEKNKPRDELIVRDGSVAYFTTINVRHTFNEIKEAGIPVRISNSAGTYVCNNLIYGALHYLTSSEKFSKIKYGFIHIPYLPKQAAEMKKITPSMPLSLIKKAILITIKTNLD